MRKLEMGHYWVYVNHPNNKALLHEATCSHCNDGRGITDDKLASNGEWHGPFGNAALALKRACDAGKLTVRWCGHCARRLKIS